VRWCTWRHLISATLWHLLNDAIDSARGMHELPPPTCLGFGDIRLLALHLILHLEVQRVLVVSKEVQPIDRRRIANTNVLPFACSSLGRCLPC
jgi:hypothetical protein